MKQGFTLAEVLITLGVIGVVSAITMPSVINHYKEKQTVTQLKKTYSVLGQAFQNIIAEYGTPDNWDLEDANSFRDLFAKYLKYIKKCDSGESGCEPEHIYWLKGLEIKDYNSYNTNPAFSHLILNDGTILNFYLNPISYDKTCSTTVNGIDNQCRLTIHTDINNFKAPNTWGKDRFQFSLTKTKIIPTGADQTKFEEDCLSSTGYGENCSAWVLMNENLDYLHCNDLSWNGKTKCK